MLDIFTSYNLINVLFNFLFGFTEEMRNKNHSLRGSRSSSLESEGRAKQANKSLEKSQKKNSMI